MARLHFRGASVAAHAGGCGSRRTVLSASLSVLWGLAGAAAVAQEASLSTRIEAALFRLGPHTISAVRVLALPQGDVLYERNPDLSLNPASNMKLLTSAAALAKLGPEYRFSTRVLAERGPERRGKVRGDLCLVGGGDPVLETDDLEHLADDVRAAGVREVSGDLVVDDYRFDDVRLGSGWEWDDEPFYYAAQISALSVNRGIVTIAARPGPQAGAPADVRIEPVAGEVSVVSEVRTGPEGSESRLVAARLRGSNELRVTGSVPVGAAEPVRQVRTIENPQRYAGALFRKLLQDRGVRVRGRITRRPAPSGAVEVATRPSPPLAEIAALLNKPSDNLVAEMLLKEIGYRHRGVGSAEAGSAAIEAWLREIGINPAGMRVADGSGLSRHDLVTARLVSSLLLHAEGQPWHAAFLASLPIGGVDGTLRNRMRSTAAAQRVLAKTGTLSNVSALSGYVTTTGGRRMVFSVLINHHGGPISAKRVEDTIAVALAEAPEAELRAASAPGFSPE